MPEMNNLTLGANLKSMYPGSYDDLPDDQLGDAVAKKYGPMVESGGEDPNVFGKIWEFLNTPTLPEIDREKFMPDETSGSVPELRRFFGEVAYQTYRGLIRPASAPLTGVIGAGVAVPGMVRRATLAATGLMGAAGAMEGAERLMTAENHGERVSAAVDTALSSLMGFGGLAGAAAMPQNIAEAPIQKIPRVFRQWREWARATPEQRAALGGKSEPVAEPQKPSPEWYVFRSMKNINDKLFKAPKGGRAPSSVPATTFNDAVNNPQLVPPGDGFWLGLKLLAEQKMRDGEPVTLHEILTTVNDNLTITHVYRGSTPQEVLQNARIFAEEHPEYRRVQGELNQLRERLNTVNVHWENLGDATYEALSEGLTRFQATQQGRPQEIRSHPLLLDVSGAPMEWGGLETVANDTAYRLLSIARSHPERFTEALDPEYSGEVTGYHRYLRRVLPLLEQELPEAASVLRSYVEEGNQYKSLRASFSQMSNSVGELYARLQEEFKAQENISGGVVYAQNAPYKNYRAGIYMDGAYYEANSVVVNRSNDRLLEDKINHLHIRLSQIGETLKQAESVERERQRGAQGRLPFAGRGIPDPTALEALRAERDRISEEHKMLYDALQMSSWRDPHFTTNRSVGHIRLHWKMSRRPDGSGLGWTCEAKEVQSDWNEDARSSGMKGDFKVRDFGKIYDAAKKIDGLQVQIQALKKGRFTPFMIEEPPKPLGPLFPDYIYKEPGEPTPFDLTMKDFYKSGEVTVGGRKMPLWDLTWEQRNQLISQLEADITKIQEGVKREQTRLLGTWHKERQTIYERDPATGQEIYDPTTGYRTHEEDRWVQGYAERPKEYDVPFGPFADDVNKSVELLLKSFIRRALEAGDSRGTPAEYVSIIGGKLSAISQGYGMPYNHIDIAPVPVPYPSSEAKGQQSMFLYNARLVLKRTRGEAQYDDKGDAMYNLTLKDIEDLVGSHVAGRLASSGWGGEPRLWGEVPLGQPLLQKLEGWQLDGIRAMQDRINSAYRKQTTRDKHFADYLKEQGVIQVPGQEGFYKIDADALYISAQNLSPADRLKLMPIRIPLGETVVAPKSESNNTYRGQVAAYDYLYKSILAKIAKENGTEVEPAETWVEGNYGTTESPGVHGVAQESGKLGDWYPVWRIKVTDKLRQSLLYQPTTVSP